MPKYINADDIKNDIKTLWDWETVDGIKSSTVLKQVLSDIDNINEAVVRCKDCSFYGRKGCIEVDGYAYCSKISTMTRKIDYCSYAERKSKVKRCFDIPENVANMLLEDTERR